MTGYASVYSGQGGAPLPGPPPLLSRLGLLPILGPLPAVAAVLAIGLLGSPLPVLAISAFVVIAYAALLAGVAEAARVQVEPAGAVLAGLRPALELMDTIPLAAGPAAIGVAGATGVCPLGYRPGCTWALDRGGHLTPQLCLPAVAALGRALSGLAAGDGEARAVCRCPLGDRAVEFSASRSQS